MKLVYHLQWEGTAVAELAPHHPDVTFVEAATPEQAIREIADADALVIAGPYYVGPVAEAVNSQAQKLRWIQTSSIGTDKFEQGGVPGRVSFTNAAGLKGRTVAEHAMAILLAHVHAIPAMERHRGNGVWARDALRKQVYSLEGNTMLLLGYGSIGREIARKAKAFDMNVVALSRTGTDGGLADQVATVETLPEWLPKADFVVATLPLTAETKHLIGAAEFALMKPDAVLVNVGRGAVVDHAALVDALTEKRIAAACLDVFEFEPLADDDPLWGCENLVLSPHVAGTGGPLGERFAGLVSENITRFVAGDPLRNLVPISNSTS